VSSGRKRAAPEEPRTEMRMTNSRLASRWRFTPGASRSFSFWTIVASRVLPATPCAPKAFLRACARVVVTRGCHAARSAPASTSSLAADSRICVWPIPTQPPASSRLLSVVPGEGVEPSRPFGQRILSPQRLPFRHPGAKSLNNKPSTITPQQLCSSGIRERTRANVTSWPI
jgi:hypothetical protein